MIGVCGDLVGDVTRGLQQDSEWQMELLDDSQQPSFGIRLVAETLVPTAAGSDVGKPTNL